MRIILFISTITLSICLFCFYSTNVLQATTDEMIEALNILEELIMNSNWSKATDYADSFEKKWEKNKFIWSVLLDHREIDNIQLSIAHIKSYIKTEDFSEVKAEIAGLNLYLKHIPEIERLNLENVL